MRPNDLLHAGLLLFAMAAVAPTAVVAQPVLLALEEPNAQDAGFGGALAALDSNVVASGATGVVYLMDGATGTLLRTFPPPDANANGSFGQSLATTGGNLIVGAPLYDDGAYSSGRAYLIDGSTGGLVQTFPNPTPDLYEEFGGTVAALASNVLVGASGAGDSAFRGGAAYLFDGSTAALLKTFLDPTPANYEYFGTSVAALGANVLVGAPDESSVVSGGGAVYLFDASTGALIRTFTAPVPQAGDRFGAAVGAFGSNVLVGTPGDDGGISLSDAGAVYLFDAGSGALLRTFPNPGADTFRTHFGSVFAMLGGNLLIGQDPEPSANAFGAAYLLDGGTGALLRTLYSPSTSSGFNGKKSLFGTRVAAVDDKMLVGGYYERTAYLFCGGTTGCGPCQTCGPAGTCVVAPHPTCLQAPGTRGAKLAIRNKTPDGSDRVLWKGVGPLAGAIPDPPGEIFGSPTDPAIGHDYTLCLFDEAGPSLLFRATAPAGGDCDGRPCWTPTFAGHTFFAPLFGYRYRDRLRTPDGLDKMELRTVSTGATKIFVRGVGEQLSNAPPGMPALPLTLPVRVQLQIDGGRCWDAEYSAAHANTSEFFRANSD